MAESMITIGRYLFLYLTLPILSVGTVVYYGSKKKLGGKEMGAFLNGLSMIFVIAKLLGLITWGWAVVFVPTYIYLIISLLAIIVATIIIMIDSK